LHQKYNKIVIYLTKSPQICYNGYYQIFEGSGHPGNIRDDQHVDKAKPAVRLGRKTTDLFIRLIPRIPGSCTRTVSRVAEKSGEPAFLFGHVTPFEKPKDHWKTGKEAVDKPLEVLSNLLGSKWKLVHLFTRDSNPSRKRKNR